MMLMHSKPQKTKTADSRTPVTFSQGEKKQTT